jgi:(E)-4-hydroxy-3-methylbut-2-enyl-diphosphate synthase
MKIRRKTRRIRVGGVPVGGGAPVSVQSMTNTDTRNVRATVAQIRSLAREGCEIARVAVPDAKAAAAFGKIRAGSPIPVIADIHFDHRLAIACADAGADCLRINPGNVGVERNTIEVLRAARTNRIPVRIGVNAGSVEKDLLAKYGGPTPKALVASAARYLKICEKARFTALKFSLKASDVVTTIEAYRLFSRRYDFPLHIGVTEAGTIFSGTIKSSVGIGVLLAEGIGDTLRVSLTGPPEEEVRVGWQILKSLGLRHRGPEFISCPTCATEVERRLSHLPVPLKVAVMGCAVNGPGEAREADVGVAGGKGEGLIFVKGRIVKKVKESGIAAEVVRIAEALAAEKRRGE